jgi:hypothetical protein
MCFFWSYQIQANKPTPQPEKSNAMKYAHFKELKVQIATFGKSNELAANNTPKMNKPNPARRNRRFSELDLPAIH